MTTVRRSVGERVTGRTGRPGRERPGPGPLSTFRTAVICLALLLEGMSSSSINVQIHEMTSDLGLGASHTQLVVGAFLLAYAGCLPVAGRLADVWSRRAAFRCGVVLFGVGCVACAVADGALLLVAGRLVQGAGAALSAPAALALITAGLQEGTRRNRAVAIYGAMGAAGFSLGLVLPGFVVAQLGWRASFLLLVPIVLAVLAVTANIAANPPGAGGRVDLVGAALVTGSLVVAVHILGAVGTLGASTLLLEAGVLVLLVGGLVVRGGIEGYPRAVITSQPVAAACVAIAGIFAAVLGSMLVLCLGLQLQERVDAFTLGLLILPQPVCFTLSAGLGARLVSRWGPWRVLTAGGLVLVVALTHLAVVGSHTPWWAGVLPAMAAVGFSLGLAFPAASIVVVNATAEQDRGTAASLLTTAQNVGGAVGVALLTALTLVPEARSTVGVQPAMTVAVGFVMLALVLAGTLVLGRRRGVAR